MKLYTNPFSPNARKVLAVAHELEIPLETHMVDLRSGEQRTPGYLAINPNGKVPVLVDGETTLWESNAILCYLASQRESSLWPKSHKRYEILRWMFWESNHFTPPLNDLFGEKFFRGDNPNQEVIDRALKSFRKYGAVLDQKLHGAHFVAGDTLTLADFAIGVGLGYADLFDLPLDDLPHVQRWWHHLRDTPSGQLLLP